jgi:hypothetical protein
LVFPVVLVCSTLCWASVAGFPPILPACVVTLGRWWASTQELHPFFPWWFIW